MATDPKLSVGLLNVGGGPIVDIARLSTFRGNLRDSLAVEKPNFLNGGPGLNGFTEDLPLRQDAPMTAPHPGAIQLQEAFASINWYDRSGSPEGFAPLLRLRKPAIQPDKSLLFQTAYGDATVPNPTAGTMYRAGGPLRPRHLFPPRQVGAAAQPEQSPRVAGRSNHRPGRAQPGAAAGLVAPIGWYTAPELQPRADGGAGGNHWQLRLPPLRGPRIGRGLRAPDFYTGAA